MALCSTKLSLLNAYVSSLNAHNDVVREYSYYLQSGLFGDIPGHRERFEVSLESYRKARKSYTDHLDEHGC